LIRLNYINFKRIVYWIRQLVVLAFKRNSMVMNHLRISNKYGSLTRNKFLMKCATTLKQHDVYSKYALLRRFQIDVCWLVKIQFGRRIDVWNWCLISIKISDLWCARLDVKPRLLRHICLVGSFFQGSYTSIFIIYS
jgi:hypothetical protein